ncbi:MAG: dipicolinate synthase subunit B [Clostridia bacterium]|nr:dipicolinate synthase subunit B [Clostridia bacterium]
MTTVGFAICGSFCTFKAVFEEIKGLKNAGYNIIPIMSENSYTLDTRFGDAVYWRSQLAEITENRVIHSIPGAEPIGPKKLLDALIIAPCTGNTLAKLALGVTDTAVTLAAKAHLRNGRPLIIAPSTNDGLSNSAKNIGALLNYKNIYFVPFGEDDSLKKPTSMVADFSRLKATLEMALEGKQIQPIVIEPK